LNAKNQRIIFKKKRFNCVGLNIKKTSVTLICEDRRYIHCTWKTKVKSTTIHSSHGIFYILSSNKSETVLKFGIDLKLILILFVISV